MAYLQSTSISLTSQRRSRCRPKSSVIVNQLYAVFRIIYRVQGNKVYGVKVIDSCRDIATALIRRHLISIVFMKKMGKQLNRISEFAEKNPDILVVWLYGSRAKGDSHQKSDYDLAVAFGSFIKDPVEKRLRPEYLALDWQKILGLHEFQLSVVDINQIPIPLAWEIIKADTVLY